MRAMWFLLGLSTGLFIACIPLGLLALGVQRLKGLITELDAAWPTRDCPAPPALASVKKMLGLV